METIQVAPRSPDKIWSEARVVVTRLAAANAEAELAAAQIAHLHREIDADKERLRALLTELHGRLYVEAEIEPPPGDIPNSGGGIAC